MTRVRAAVDVALPPGPAEELWTDLRRWPSFVEGFGHVIEAAPEWPDAGAKLVWQSVPGGRGRVTERVVERVPGRRIAVRVFEERLAAVQTLTFEPAGAGARVTAELDYELAHGGPLRALANLLFIRRAVGDALARSLRRFAVEAADEARRR